VTDSLTIAHHESESAPQSDIEAALQRSAALQARKIAVEIDGSTVILTGDVHTHSELDEAVRIAWSARGVRNVENCITVTPWGTGPSNEWGY
jgi:osmotically-inducible protein OsmY